LSHSWLAILGGWVEIATVSGAVNSCERALGFRS